MIVGPPDVGYTQAFPKEFLERLFKIIRQVMHEQEAARISAAPKFPRPKPPR